MAYEKWTQIKGEKTILIWYGDKMRYVPVSVIYRKFLLQYFDLRYLTDAISIQIYYDRVIRIRYETYPNFFETFFMEDVSQQTINTFLEILNSDEDYFGFNNRFKAVEIDAESGIHIIVCKKDMKGISYNELPIKVYGFLKPMRLGTGEITFSYQNMCDEISPSELEDIEDNLREELKCRQF